MPPPVHHTPPTRAAELLVAVAPLVNRWIERLLAENEPPLTVGQFLVLRGIAAGAGSGSELARRAGVSGPAVSQLVGGLADAGLLTRRESDEDRRRQALALSASGKRALASAEALLGRRLSPMLEALPHPEADALAHTLERVEALLSGEPPPRRPRPRGPTRPRPHRPPKAARGKPG